MKTLTPEQAIGVWEDQRDIKNLMGRYMVAIELQKESEIFERFWTQSEEEPVLGTSEGYYKGKDAICDYYNAFVAHDKANAARLLKAFPDRVGRLSEEEQFGIGEFDMLPITSPIIEVAGDGQTAKGIWFSHGTYVRLTPSGPVSYWTMGFYCVDFVREAGVWKFWHLVYNEEINTACGQSWATEPAEFPLREEFSGFAEKDPFPAPNAGAAKWKKYQPYREFQGTPPVPVPYETFSETFSYGV